MQDCDVIVVGGRPAVVARLLSTAQREWPVRVERDFSFSSRAYAGERWNVVGDAGSFLDPVFSTGVAIALESGLEGAKTVAEGLAAGDLTARRFNRFSRRQRQRYMAFRRFVLGFYTREFRDLFFQQRSAGAHVPLSHHGVCGILEADARRTHLGDPFFPAGAAATLRAVRSSDRREPAGGAPEGGCRRLTTAPRLPMSSANTSAAKG